MKTFKQFKEEFGIVIEDCKKNVPLFADKDYFETDCDEISEIIGDVEISDPTQLKQELESHWDQMKSKTRLWGLWDVKKEKHDLYQVIYRFYGNHYEEVLEESFAFWKKAVQDPSFVETLSKENEELQELLRSKDKIIQTLTGENEDLKQRIAGLLKELEQWKSEVSRLKTQIESIRKGPAATAQKMRKIHAKKEAESDVDAAASAGLKQFGQFQPQPDNTTTPAHTKGRTPAGSPLRPLQRV